MADSSSRKLKNYLSQWNLTLEETPLPTPTGIVAKVRWNNQPCILKIGSAKGDENTASVLKHYDGYGAVRLIKFEERVTLLERAMPGTHLSELTQRGEDDQATHILCDVIEKLHYKKTFSGTYPSISDLNKGFRKYLKSADTQIPYNLVREAQSIYEKLAESQGPPLLLHGDLHHDNVLYDETRGWLAIDPKGYRGEPAYEVGAFLRNPLHYPKLYQNPELMKHRLSIICDRLGFERERIIAWAFSQAVLAGIWSVEDGESPRWAIESAQVLKRTLNTAHL